MFDRRRLQQAAARLAALFPEYRQIDDEYLQGFLNAISGLVARSQAGEVRRPVAEVPGTYAFVEGHLDEYRELLAAYAAFSMLVTTDHDELDDFMEWAGEFRRRIQNQGTEDDG